MHTCHLKTFELIQGLNLLLPTTFTQGRTLTYLLHSKILRTPGIIFQHYPHGTFMGLGAKSPYTF